MLFVPRVLQNGLGGADSERLGVCHTPNRGQNQQLPLKAAPGALCCFHLSSRKITAGLISLEGYGGA